MPEITVDVSLAKILDSNTKGWPDHSINTLIMEEVKRIANESLIDDETTTIRHAVAQLTPTDADSAAIICKGLSNLYDEIADKLKRIALEYRIYVEVDNGGRWLQPRRDEDDDDSWYNSGWQTSSDNC